MVGIFSRNKGQNFGQIDQHKTVGKVILLNPDEIAPNPAQPRQEFDLEALKSLADSIKLNGVLQPILVRKTDPIKSDKPYELISGERRLRASKLCGNDTVPAIVMESTNARQSAVYAILENIQRKDLNLFEEAAALRTLVVEWGVTQEEAAAKLGMAQSTIANKMRLLALSPSEQQTILENRLTERHGRALLRLPCGENRETVTQMVGERHLTVRETEELVERLLAGETLQSIEQSGQENAGVSEPPPAQQIPVLPEPQPVNLKRRGKPRKVMLVKDVRIFLNTVNQAIDAMKHAGIPAESHQEDHGEYIEYLVRIPTSRVQGIRSRAAKNG